jgi:epoxyqueuosine reductase
VADKVIDSRKCISYLTIENKGTIPATFKGKTENWIFGCDICQDVCPWNRKNKPTPEVRFHPGTEMVSMHDKDWEDLSQEDFEAFFKKSPIQRPGYPGLKRNIENCGGDPL